MTVRCAWCREIMGCTFPLRCHETTDGICVACYDEQVREIEAVHRFRPVDDVSDDSEDRDGKAPYSLRW